MNDLLAKRAIYELKYKDEDDVFMTVALDFDGTCVTHCYPDVGEDLPNCVETLKKWHKDYGVAFILSTMRPDGKLLNDAIEWFKERDIPLYAVHFHPTQDTWTNSPKSHARWCIDDRNIGQPLTTDNRGVPCVDWKKTAELFEPTLKATHDALIKSAK